MRISIVDFKGQAPRRTARLLPENYAQKAVSTRLERGTLGPVRAPANRQNLVSDAQTIYRTDAGTWLSWDAKVHVAPGPIATERLYITGDGAPKMRVSGTTYPLALPAPAAAPTLSIVSGTLDSDLAEEVLYAYTYVTSLGEESAPSQLSAGIQWSPGLVVRLSDMSVPPAGRLITDIRIYRSVTSATGSTDLYYVDEISATTSYDHDLDLAPIQDAAPTVDFSEPVDDLEGLIALPNGIMAAFEGQTLYFCEPYQPHAWPAKYSLFTDYPIVGLAGFGSYVAVLTEGTPYRVQGSHPDNMTMEKIEQDLPCLSAEGIVDLGYSAAYPSTEGLVLISAGGAQVITEPLFTFEQWQALQPATIVAARYNGRYWFSYDGDLGGTSAKGAMIDLTGDMPFLIEIDEHALATFRDVRDGRLFYLSSARQIDEWDPVGEGSHVTLTWRSKVFVVPQPVNLAAMLIESTSDSGSELFTAHVYADGTLIHTEYVFGAPTRLPAGFLAHRWEVELQTTAEVEAITLASSMEELLAP